MVAELGAYWIGHLMDIQGEGGVLEALHHPASAELAQIAALFSGRAARERRGEIFEGFAVRELLQKVLGFVFMLDENVAGLDFHENSFKPVISAGISQECIDEATPGAMVNF
jgi:hypothetical protein